MIKKIDKLILRSFWKPFITTLAVVIFIFLMRIIVTYFADLFGKDLGLELYLKLFFYFSLITVPIALPLAMLLSSLMTYGNLGEYFELTAIKSAGISITRAMLPMFVVTLMITVFTFWFNNVALPWANLKGYSLLYDIKTTKTTLNIKEGIFYNDLPGYSIKISKKYPDNKTLKNIIIFDHTKNDGDRHVTIADSALMYTIMDKQYLVFELFNGNDYNEDADKTSNSNQTDLSSNGFKKSKQIMSLSAFDMHKTEEDQFAHHQMMKGIEQLSYDSDSLKKSYQQIKEGFYITIPNYFLYENKALAKDSKVGQNLIKNKKIAWIDSLLIKKQKSMHYNAQNVDYALSQANTVATTIDSNSSALIAKEEDYDKTDLEWHRKFTGAIAVFVMFLIGAPLGGIIKKGGFGLPVVVAIVFFILMYVMTQQGEKAAKESRLIVQVGAWLSNTVLFLIGLYFLNKARNDSRLFEADNYIIIFNRWKEKIMKSKLVVWFMNKKNYKLANAD
ncbi:MAG: LptF/LptG family permease [Arcicella sp.]|nr:LptF/LptG family permease [Arcicella sp.]